MEWSEFTIYCPATDHIPKRNPIRRKTISFWCVCDKCIVAPSNNAMPIKSRGVVRAMIWFRKSAVVWDCPAGTRSCDDRIAARPPWLLIVPYKANQQGRPRCKEVVNSFSHLCLMASKTASVCSCVMKSVRSSLKRFPLQIVSKALTKSAVKGPKARVYLD